MPETNEKIKVRENIRRTNGNFRTEKYNNEIKHTMNEVNRKRERTRENISDLGDGTIEVTESGQQRDYRLNNKNKQSLRDVWDCTKGLTFMSLRSQKRGEKGLASYLVNYWLKISQI